MQLGGYADPQAPGIVGMLADVGPREVMSLLNAGSSAVPYGLGVVDKGDQTFAPLDAAHLDIAGVTLLEHATDHARESVASVPVKRAGSILRRGKVYVQVETAVSAGDDAYCRFANGVADTTQTTQGAWGGDDDTNTRRHVKGATFRSSASKNGLAILELTDALGSVDLIHASGGVGALSATSTVDLGAVPSGRQVRLHSALLSAGVAEGDATDYWTFELRADSTVLARWVSQASADGRILVGQPREMNVLPRVTGAPGKRLRFLAIKSGAAANLTAGQATAVLEVL